MPRVLRRLFQVNAFRIGLVTGLSFAALHAWELANPRGAAVLGRLEGAIADARFRSIPQQSRRVVVAAIDEAAIKRFGRFPWSRRVVAEVVDRLDAQKPAAIGFDITFSDSDRLAEVSGAERLRTRFDEISLRGPLGQAAMEHVNQAASNVSAASSTFAALEPRAKAVARARYGAAEARLAAGMKELSAATQSFEALAAEQARHSAELDRELSGGDADGALADAIRRAGPKVVLGYIANTEGESRGLDQASLDGGVRQIESSRLVAPQYQYRVQAGLDRLVPVPASWLPEYFGVTSPQRTISATASSFGFINASPDEDGVIRRAMLAAQVRGRILPSLDTMLVAVALGVPPERVVPVTSDDGRSTGRAHLAELAFANKLVVPTDPRGMLRINYSGGRGAFPHYSIADVMDGRTPAGALIGKVVLVGVTAQGTFDQRLTPFENDSPGIDIHANAVETMLTRNFLRRGVSIRVLEMLLLVVLAPLFAWIFARVRVGLALPALFATAAALWAGNVALFRAGYDVTVALPLVEIAAMFVLVTTYRYAVEERDRRALRKAFQLYLNPDVMDEMLRQPDKLQLGGEERDLTVLFSDIRGFTAISEKLPPQVLVHLLNEYLSPMTEIVFRKRGTLDKYIGDAVMAFFGAPGENPRHALHCCEVALEMVGELARLRDKWRLANGDISQLDIGIGVNSGKMVVGNMGSAQRFNYTVVGDNVNVASRLEALNKVYGTRILITEATLKSARASGGDPCVRELDWVRVIGKTEPVRLFELRGLGPVRDEDLALLNGYARGLELYRARRFAEARVEFDSLGKRFPQDAPSLLFASRCEEMLVAPPADEWDGAFQLATK